MKHGALKNFLVEALGLIGIIAAGTLTVVAFFGSVLLVAAIPSLFFATILYFCWNFAAPQLAFIPAQYQHFDFLVIFAMIWVVAIARRVIAGKPKSYEPIIKISGKSRA